MYQSNGVGQHDSRLELVDDLRMQDIQVTGLSVPILVRPEGRRQSSWVFIENNIWPNALRNLIMFTESPGEDSPLNLRSVLYQHNSSPLLSYNETPNTNVGGMKEDAICTKVSSLFTQAAAPNIVKQLSWFYIFDHKLSYIIPGWSQPPLVQYFLYTISSRPHDSVNFIPYCEPATKWIYCLRGKVTVRIMSPTQSNVEAFKRFLEIEDKNELYSLFQTDSTEAKLGRGHALFIPAGWIFYAEREPCTLEYGGEFFHSFSIEDQFGIWQLYSETYLNGSDTDPSSFFSCHWLVLHSYLSSFQDTMLTTQEIQFNLESHRSLLPHLSPFECRGMLFMIELIRSGRLPILRQCIPSCVKCPVSLLQKMQTILLHQSIFSIFSSPIPNGVMFVGTSNDGITSIFASECSESIAKNKLPSLPILSIANSTLQSSVNSSNNQCKDISRNNNVTTIDHTDSIETISNAKSLTTGESDSSPSSCLRISIPLTRLNLRNKDDYDYPYDIQNSVFPSPLGTNTSSLYYSDTKSLNGNNENSDSQLSYKSCNLTNNDNAQLTSMMEVHSSSDCTLREFLTAHISDSKLRFCGICQYCTQPARNPCSSCQVRCRKNCSCNDRFCIFSGIADIDISPEMLLNAPPIFTKFVQILCAYPPLSLQHTLAHILDETIQLSKASFLPVKRSSLKDIQNILIKIQSYEFGRLSTPIDQSTPLNTPSK